MSEEKKDLFDRIEEKLVEDVKISVMNWIRDIADELSEASDEELEVAANRLQAMFDELSPSTRRATLTALQAVLTDIEGSSESVVMATKGSTEEVKESFYGEEGDEEKAPEEEPEE